MKRKNITIREDQAEWVERSDINLSQLVQDAIDEKMGPSEPEHRMNVSRGDIVEVDLDGPTDDDTRGSEIYKKRPAVVIQSDIGNQRNSTTIVAPISGGTTSFPFQVNLPASTPGLLGRSRS